MLSHLLSAISQYENKNHFAKLAILLTNIALKKSKLNPAVLKSVVVGKWIYKKVVPHMLFEVCSACQHSCVYCAHAGLIKHNPAYSLTIPQLQRFIQATQESNYFIENLWIHGPGEPTLWKHFNVGVRMLRDSAVVGNINIETNGQSLDLVEKDTWRCVSLVSLSLYPSSKRKNFRDLKVIAKKNGITLRINTLDSFRMPPGRRYHESLPARCVCPGPMVYGDTIFYSCGPPAIDAALLCGADLMSDKECTGDLRLDYLAGITVDDVYGVFPKAKRSMDLCSYCWANWSIRLEEKRHAQFVRGRGVTEDGRVSSEDFAPPRPPA